MLRPPTSHPSSCCASAVSEGVGGALRRHCLIIIHRVSCYPGPCSEISWGVGGETTQSTQASSSLNCGRLLPALPATGTAHTPHGLTATCTATAHACTHDRTHMSWCLGWRTLAERASLAASNIRGCCVKRKVSAGRGYCKARVWASKERACRFAVYLLLLQARLCSASRCPTRPLPPQGRRARQGCTLANEASRIRETSGSERPRAAMSSPASLPKEIQRSAERGELQKVVKWLRKGGAVDALCSTTTHDGRVSIKTLLRTAAAYDQLEVVKELLKRVSTCRTASATPRS